MTERPKRPPIQDVLRAKQEERSAAETAVKAVTDRPSVTARSTPFAQVTDRRRQAWLDSMIRWAVERLGAATEGTRNDELNRVAYTLGGIVHLGLDERAARDTLHSVARQIGLTSAEIPGTLDSGFGKGKTEPLTVELAERKLLNGTVEPPPDDPELKAFWGERHLLQHIHDYARARRVSPWAVLGVELARAAAATLPTIVLPPLVGGHASLNYFVGLVGLSGSGKGGAERVAAEAITMPHIEAATVGSGEGIAHGYRKRLRDGTLEHLRDQMIFSVPEVDTLAAVGGRQGATLLPELRRAWSGEALGFAYADATKRLPVAAHTYRLCLILGIQPGRAAALLDDVDGGTPQRFVWLPATDRAAPEDAPPAPDRVTWEPPPFDSKRVTPFSGGLAAMGVCEAARAAIDEAALARLRGQPDALDGHALLAQLKTAAALAVLDGRYDVEEPDWLLAERIMTVSSRTRAMVADNLQEGATKKNRARAESDAHRAVVVGEKLAEAAAQRASRRILTVLRQRGPLTRSPLRKAVRQNDRGSFDEAVEALLKTSQIIRDADQKGTVRYGIPQQ